MLSGSPRPSSARVVSARIDSATVSTVLAKITGITFGRMCLVTRCQLPEPKRARTFHVRSLLYRQGVGSHQSRGSRPRRHADHQDRVEQRATEDRSQHDRQGDPRDHQEPVRERVHHRVGLPAEVAAGDPDRSSERHGHDGGCEPDEERDTRAVDHEVEHRPAEVVRAERELEGGRLERFARRVRDSEVLRADVAAVRRAP